ncbi:cytochrome c-type biogenesis protein [Nannocystis pusilla]|uniref:cytochrome c-type biogenesis protein n=1 Tax=Nannocystis pusilla TaxID=889268 RepID=UPI003B81178C
MLELSHDLMSPYCPGRTIATCPSPNARKLEAQILDQARSGESRETIENTLVARFPISAAISAAPSSCGARRWRRWWR